MNKEFYYLTLLLYLLGISHLLKQSWVNKFCFAKNMLLQWEEREIRLRWEITIFLKHFLIKLYQKKIKTLAGLVANYPTLQNLFYLIEFTLFLTSFFSVHLSIEKLCASTRVQRSEFIAKVMMATLLNNFTQVQLYALTIVSFVCEK